MRVFGRFAGASLVTTVFAFVLAVPVATAQQTWSIVVDGLHNPRGLWIGPGNILYVAEAGDATQEGRISQIVNPTSMHPRMRSIVEGLATEFTPEQEWLGLSGISVVGRGTNTAIYGIMGLAPQTTGDSSFGRLLRIGLDGSTETVTNVGSYMYDWTAAREALRPQDFPDSNPYAVLALPDHVYVADAGANTLNEVLPDGTIKVLAYFPDSPIGDAIPTCVAQGPDGALYVGTLAFVEGLVLGPMAKVYRLDPADANLADPRQTPMQVWASGLFPINGCTFGPDGTFYASQLFTHPAGVPPAIFADPQGDVVKIPFDSPSTHTFLTGGGLRSTAGVAVAPNGDVYVADGTAFGEVGRIIRIR